MNFKCLASILIAIGVSANAQTEVPSEPANLTVVKPIVKAIEEETSAGTAAFADFCRLNNGKTLKVGRRVILVGETECKPKYSSTSTTYYEIAVDGNIRYVEKSAISATADEVGLLKSLSKESSEFYTSNAKVLSADLRIVELERLAKFLESNKSAGLTIFQASIAEVSEYTEGTSFFIKVGNPTGKTIKYLWFTVVGYNAVHDPVRDRLKGGPSLTVRAIGPVEKDEAATYKWDYMWHTDIVQFFDIKEVKIQYMDGSTRVIKNWKTIALDAQNLRVFQELHIADE